MTCLITGCSLVCGNASVHGDLHVVADAYVFNAVLTAKGEASWDYGVLPLQTLKQIDASACRHYFERRGMIVFEQANAQLNAAAREYLK